MPRDAACANQSGLAWDVTRADNGIPTIVGKNGGLPGFSSEVRLVPSLDLGVVVLVDSVQRLERAPKPDATAAHITSNILYALIEQQLR